MIKDYFDGLSPKTKRVGIIAASALAVVAIVSVFSGNDERQVRDRTPETIRHVLTDTNTREVGIESLAADIKIANKKNDDLTKELERLKERVNAKEEKADKDSIPRSVQNEIKKMKEQIEKLKEQDQSSKSKRKSGDEDEGSTDDKSSSGTDAVDTSGFDRNNLGVDGYLDPNKVFENAQLPKAEQTSDGKVSRGEVKPVTMTISSFSSRSNETNKESSESKDKNEVYLPAGSIITGVLINGMDAPTGRNAQANPFPSTIRIQKEAILPNRFRADIRECFLIVSGHGDLSSERAFLRGETLSCVKDNGDVIETNLKSYAVGEDGKAGVRGRLVSKQGQIIAKSLMAGFLSGAADAFDVNNVPTLNLSGNAQQQTNNFNKTFGQGVAAKGASNALDRIAQFYIEMAEGIFPVIEVDAGRQVEVIVSQGSTLTVRGSKAKLDTGNQ